MSTAAASTRKKRSRSNIKEVFQAVKVPKRSSAKSPAKHTPSKAVTPSTPTRKSTVVEPKENVEITNNWKIRRADPPAAIFKHVGYTPSLSPERQYSAGSSAATHLPSPHAKAMQVSAKAAKTRASNFIQDNYVVPEDFERPIRFGPVSGSNFEDRLIQAYMRNMLDRKSGLDEVVILPFKSSVSDKIEQLVDQGFSHKESTKMLVACGWVVKDALELLCDNWKK